MARGWMVALPREIQKLKIAEKRWRENLQNLEGFSKLVGGGVLAGHHVPVRVKLLKGYSKIVIT